MEVCEGGVGTKAAPLEQALLLEGPHEVGARGGGHLLDVLLDAARVDLLEGLDVGRAGVDGLGDLAGALLEGHAADVDLLGLHAQVEQAHAYNDALSAGAVLEANNHVPTGAGSSKDSSLNYANILKANNEGLMARLKIPSISLDLPVYHGTADDTLLKGLGHLEGTSLPVGGEGTRSVITGHRGLAEATMFTNLDKVKTGDSLIVEVFGEVLTYRVTSTKVVEPEETEALRVEEGKDLLTLVTCTPLGINTHRILLTGERIYPTPAKDLAAAGKRPDVPHFPWWAVGLAAGLIVIGLYLWRSGYAAARAKERARAAQEDPRPQTWAEQMRIWMDDDAGVEPQRWFTDLPVPPQPSEMENLALLEEIASLSAPSGQSDNQELIDTAEIPVLDATRPSAGASGRTHSL